MLNTSAFKDVKSNGISQFGRMRSWVPPFTKSIMTVKSLNALLNDAKTIFCKVVYFKLTRNMCFLYSLTHEQCILKTKESTV